MKSALSYQVLVPKFWSDHKIRNMPLVAKTTAAALITCAESSTSSRSGIYEIHRSDICRLIHTIDGVNLWIEEDAFDLMGWREDELKRFLKKDNLSEEDKKRAMGYFNREKKELIEYDPETHCVHVKSMFKYAYLSGLIKTPKAVANVVKKTLEFYEDKCPSFVVDFAQINSKILRENYKKLSPRDASFDASKEAFEKLFFLEEGKNCLVATNNPKLVSAEKMAETIKTLSKSFARS